jgi:extracellular elastinolytic metalloproteinase
VSLVRSKSLTGAAIGSTVLALSMMGLPSHAATSGHVSAARTSLAPDASQSRSAGSYDSRELTGAALTHSMRQQLGSRTKSDESYYQSLGIQSVVSMDPLTHTVRDIGKLNGYLTGRSSAPARTIALHYVQSHLSALGLHAGDLKTLRLRQDYVDPLGIHNLSWTQQAAGRTVFGNGLIVRVTRDGRVLAVQGSPVSHLAQLAAKAPSTGGVTATQARALSASNVDSRVAPARIASSRGGTAATTVWANHDMASRVWFLTSAGLRPGWSTYVQTAKGAYQHVIDSATGRTLYRHANSDDANGDALVYKNYPGAPRGGKASVVNLFKRGWLKRSAKFLKGTSVTAFLDVNDDNKIQNSEKTPVPGTKHKAQFKLKRFGVKSGSLCKRWICTWNPNKKNSWKKNSKAETTNAFFLASNFHDYLAKAPISFTSAAGNFSAKGGDPVKLNVLDGANTNHGFPDGLHVNNANMSTPPNGISPTMQMYLFHEPGLPDSLDHEVPTTGALDPSVLYHEYTHGLSNRLVVDSNGNSTLNDIQAGAMGEAWSDYYAMDYLVSHGLIKDTKKPGQLLEGKYVAGGAHLIRTMAIDCPRNAHTKGCQSGAIAGVHGGYVYGDFSSIIGIPEVHASGEIWGQTLWDLRTKLGHKITDSLVTRAMTISAEDPDYLDMRNAIVRADLVAYHGKYAKAIWKVFAHRGMGFYAGSIDSADTTPKSDFHSPPSAKNPHNGVVAGIVSDSVTHDPIPNALVQVTGQGYQYAALTNSHGQYVIGRLATGTYAKVAVNVQGAYFPNAKRGKAVSKPKFNPAKDLTNVAMTHDWAADVGGASVTAFNGPDYTKFGCGPGGAIDLSQGSGWGSTAGDNAGTPTAGFTPKFITVKLPQKVDIDAFQIDPSATCGDGLSASAGHVTLEVSANGTTFTPVANVTFTNADDGHFNTVKPTGAATGIQWVRLTVSSNQTPNRAQNCPNGAFTGCSFTDLTELAVIGSPS